VPNGSIRRGTSINTCWPALWSIYWLVDHSSTPLSWAHPLPLISLACLPNQSEIEWSQVHLLVSLHLVGTWVFICCGILMSLGGCHHLDGLEQRWRSGTCWWLFMAGSSELVVRGCCGSPVEHQIPTLVDCSCRNFSPFGRFLWHLLRGSVWYWLATEPRGVGGHSGD
jgi:hypothetical protein